MGGVPWLVALLSFYRIFIDTHLYLGLESVPCWYRRPRFFGEVVERVSDNGATVQAVVTLVYPQIELPQLLPHWPCFFRHTLAQASCTEI